MKFLHKDNDRKNEVMSFTYQLRLGISSLNNDSHLATLSRLLHLPFAHYFLSCAPGCFVEASYVANFLVLYVEALMVGQGRSDSTAGCAATEKKKKALCGNRQLEKSTWSLSQINLF